MNGSQEVIDYVVRKYGKDQVVQIVTFGTLAARGVIRDVGRVMDLPYARVDAIAKMVPNELNITIDKALKGNSEFQELYNSDEEVKNLIDMAKRLEGLPRHTSMHAAGVVISQKAVDEYVPLSRANDGTIITQFTMTTLEELGLLKMDFLGLRTLTVIQNAQKEIERETGVAIDMDAIDYDDKKVLASLGTGHTDGVFQLESAGMKSFMKELKPQNLEDVIAGISLYRPGPMDFIPKYIEGKNNPENITLRLPAAGADSGAYLRLYRLPGAGYADRPGAGAATRWGGATWCAVPCQRRKRPSWRKSARISFTEIREEGVPGCIANGIDEKTANKIYDDMIDFAKYAFNKSHAAAYAVVSYQTAWLKYYYPTEFMAALMTSVIDNPGKVSEYIYTCRQMKISILPPDVNTGEVGFSVEKGGIRYGLSAIKSVGRSFIEGMLKERRENGTFRSIKDFVERMTGKDLNKRVIENFIKAGALDGLGATRRQLMMIYASLMDQVAQERKNSLSGQMSLFDFMGEEEKKEFEVHLPDVGEYEKEELLSFEKEVLGIYISGHPLEKYETMWRKNISALTSDFQLDEETNKSQVEDESRQIIGGMITAKTVKYTRTGKPMAFVTLEDLVGTVEVIVFPKDYEKYRSLLDEEKKVFIKGHVNAEDDRPSKLVCERVWAFEEVPKELWIQFATLEDFKARERELYDILRTSDGKDHVVLYIRSPKAVKKLAGSWDILVTEALCREIASHFGQQNVKVVEKSIENLGKMN